MQEPHVEEAVITIRTVLDEYSGYRRARVAVAFSGGKDSIVLAHLVATQLAAVPCKVRPALVHFDVGASEAFHDSREAAELRAHISETMRDPRYTSLFDTSIVNDTCSLRQSVAQFVGDPPRVDVIFMGTRHGDPAAATLSQLLAPTSTGWPCFTRAMPLLHWTNRDIWAYIDAHALRYPAFYSRGFTSAGTGKDDAPHPSLRIANTDMYRHARELDDAENERAGRAPQPELSTA